MTEINQQNDIDEFKAEKIIDKIGTVSYLCGNKLDMCFVYACVQNLN